MQIPECLWPITDRLTMNELAMLDELYRWLYGMRGTGRTHVALVAALIQAYTLPNVQIQLVDHTLFTFGVSLMPSGSQLKGMLDFLPEETRRHFAISSLGDGRVWYVTYQP